MTPQEIISKLNDAKNGIYTKAELESIWIPNDMLPEAYQDNREGGKSLERLEKQSAEEEKKRAAEETDTREKSVIIHEGKIMSDNPSRLAVLDRYQAMASIEGNIEYETNEDKLYRNQLTFAAAIGLDLTEDE
tara:strand:- start:284 stop:682 length:399 start_codon:yes stop_codon:yes gene_type:complete